MMERESERRFQLPYRVLLVVILGGLLALVLAAFSGTGAVGGRTLLLVAAGVLLVVAVVVEVLFRDLRRLRARVRALEKRNGPAGR